MSTLRNERAVRPCPDEGRALESLCAAVILCALRDAQMPPHRIRKQDQAEAIAFLSGETPALAECADIIGIDAHVIRSRWREARGLVRTRG